MTLNILDEVALAYQPIWGANRQLAGVRLRIRALNPATFNAPQMLALLSGEWSADAPFLLVSLADTGSLRDALSVHPFDHIWLELPDMGNDAPTGLADAAAYAYRMGHRLVQESPLGRAQPLPVIGQGMHRFLLHLWPEEAVQAQQASSPVMREQLYRDIGTCGLAAHCLDQRSAWGLCGWPVDDALKRYTRTGVPVDKRTLVRVQQALMRSGSMETVESLIHQDAVLTFRVLRLVNSPIFGASREVTTVRQALMLLGQVRLRDWMLELMPGASSDADLLPVRLALVLRGKLMEELMDAGFQRDLATEIYVAGLFSRLDLLMQEPLHKALGRIPVSESIRDALLHGAGPYATYLELARRLERFEEVQRLPGFSEVAAFALNHVNRSLIRTLANWRNLL